MKGRFLNEKQCWQMLLESGCSCSKEELEGLLHCKARHLYHTIIKACVLGGGMPQYINTWWNEIYSDTVGIIIIKTDEDLDRVESIQRWLMYPQMGIEFEDYGVEDFQEAMITVVKNARGGKGSYPGGMTLEESDYIERSIFPNIKFLADLNKGRIQKFYVDFMSTVKEQNVDLLKQSINTLCKI